MTLEENLLKCIEDNNFNKFIELTELSSSFDKKPLILKSGELDRTEFFTFLLKFSDIDLSYSNHFLSRRLIKFNSFNCISILINDNRFNPAGFGNVIVNNAYMRYREEIINLLWKDSRVKKSLKNDNTDLFNILTKNFLQKKIKSF